MCFKRKWTKFTPTQNYLDAVKDITTVSKLDLFLNNIKPKADVGDYWQTPEETLNLLTGDCEDYARLALDILVRVMGITDARFVVYNGYIVSNKKGGHAVCVFQENNQLSVFTGFALKKGFTDYEEIGHSFYPKGIKYMEVRNDEGKVVSRKFKLFGRL